MHWASYQSHHPAPTDSAAKANNYAAFLSVLRNTVRNGSGLFPIRKPLKIPLQHELFDRWLQEHGTILHHVANGFAEGDDRQDLMQELLLAMWKAIPAFRHDAQTSTFIYRVAHNAALTWQRTRRNYERCVLRFGNLASTEPHHGPDTVSARLEQVYAAIRQLPPLDRSLMLLALDGLGYREMAAIHGLTESNIGVRLNRARHSLTTKLKKLLIMSLKSFWYMLAPL